MYFDHCQILAELKAEYRRLALLHHPDRGGDTATMQAVNAEHDRVFERLKAAQNAAADADPEGRTPHTRERAEDFRRVMDALRPLAGIEVELCGTWLWVGGKCWIHRAKLKAAGCRWAPKKAKWYWRPEEERMPRRNRHREFTMEQIRGKYGSTILMEEEGRRVACTA